MSGLVAEVRAGKAGVTAACLTAWRDGEDSPEADAGAVALADGLHELKLIRTLLNRKQTV